MIAESLARSEGPASTILYLEEDGQKQLTQVDERRFVARPYAFSQSAALISQMAQGGESLLIHSHGRRPGFHARLARLRFGKKIRVVHSFHGIASVSAPKVWVSALSESIFSVFTDAVVAAGPGEMALFRHIPLFCSSHLVMPSFNGANVVKKEYASASRVGFAARLCWPKLHHNLIDAVALANQRLATPLNLVLAGDGPDAGPICEHGKATLGDNFEWLGHVSDMAKFHKEIDLFAFCSRFEGLPLALVDAMACGLPSVATDVIGCNALIKHDHNGLLVDAQSVQDLADALAGLAEDKDLRTRLGTQAKQDMKRNHARERFISEYRGVYQQAGYPVDHLSTLE